MSGLVLPSRAPNGSAPAHAESDAPAADKGKQVAQQGQDDAGAVIPGVNGIVPTLQ